MRLLNFPKKMIAVFKYKSNEDSRIGLVVPEIIMKYELSMFGGLKTRLPILDKLVGTIVQVRHSVRIIKLNTDHGKKTISDHELEELEAYIRTLGVSGIGYTTVDAHMIFKDKAIQYNQAIVLTMEMNKASIDTVPSKTGIKEIFRTYYGLGVAVNKISSYMQVRGYNAMPSPALGGNVSYIPLAEKAGLGVAGKHGLLITDQDFGPSLRLAAVFTDIENLPKTGENPHLWVKDYCKSCLRCVKKCPSGAIYETNTLFNSKEGLETTIDYKKCAVPFTNDYGCTVCVKECTLYTGNYKKIKSAWLAREEK